LLAATERELGRIEQQTRRRNRRLESAAEIGVAVGAVIDIGSISCTAAK